MPSLTTHKIFAQELLNDLTKEEKNKFQDSINLYYIFSQSHDFLFYYTFNFNAKKIKDFGHYAHHYNTQDYLINIVKEIKDSKNKNNPDLLAYLYGSITHYVLDTTCHPFIFYKTGVRRKKEKETFKYRGEHNRIEKDLDAIYYEKYTNKKYNKCNLNKEIIGNVKFSEELTNFVSTIYKKTYNKDNIGKYYYKGIKHCKVFNTLIVNDRFGIKRFFYKLIDTITNHPYGNLSVYSTHLLTPNLNFLNNERKQWIHPCNKNLKYNYSFQDLFELSLKKTKKIIKEVNKVLYEDSSIEKLRDYIPNIDYSTGLTVEESVRMHNFEY